MPDVPIYRVGPQLRGPLYVPDMLKNREGPQAREHSKCLNGWSYMGVRLAKEDFRSPATRGWKNDSDRAITGEGNGNPLQYSFLEKPMDGGAW